MKLIFLMIGLSAMHSCVTGRDTRTNKTIIVTSVPVEPYLYVKDGKITGYIPDLMKKIAQIMHIDNYEYKINKVFGSRDEDGEWSGVIGDLIRMNADIAAAPLSITSQRSRVVDFTRPFQNAKLAVLMKKDRKATQEAVENLKDLAFQKRISYGTIKGTSIAETFEVSKITWKSRMWESMTGSTTPRFVENIDEGIQRACTYNYALIVETPVAYCYEKSPICDVETISGSTITPGKSELLEFSYALATPIGSDLRKKLDIAIGDLWEMGELEKLYDIWFKNHCDISDEGTYLHVEVLFLLITTVSQFII